MPTTSVRRLISPYGNANDVVITSEVTSLRKAFDVQGVTAFNIIWKPVKNC